MKIVGGPLLRGVDRAGFAVAFAVALRARGVPVGLPAIEDFARALEVSSSRSRTGLYWAARISLVRRQSEIEIFDAVFAAVFDDALLALDPNARRRPFPVPAREQDSYTPLPARSAEAEDGAGLPWLTLPRVVGSEADSDAAFAVPQRLPSHLDALADVPFEQLDPGQLALLGSWLESSLRSWPTRRSRRLEIDRRGRRIAVRPTLAHARRTGWESVRLVRVRQVYRPRRVVMLCDVSQSMQAQAAAYFQLMRALALVADAEVFAFATTLTRLTAVLRHRSNEAAMEQATHQVSDRFGGTRIASNIQALLSSHHGGAVRGAIVIIGSDGWDADSPEQLGAAMARLRRRAHRVIWINPRVSAPGFAPLVSTMAAALVHCDQLLPADDFRSLARVIAEIGATGRPSSTARLSSTA